MRWIRLLGALAALAASTSTVSAEPLRAPDVLRMRAFDAHLGLALKLALAEGDPDSLAVLQDAMRGAAQPVESIDPVGDWSCRTIKLGKLLPAVAYGNFACRIEAVTDGQWRLTKLTGSQRTTGLLTVTPEANVQFTGVGHVGAEPATSYADLPLKDQTPVDPNQTTASVGLFEQMGPDRARLMLPAPIFESQFDILYLTR